MPPLFRGVFNEFQDVANASGFLPPAKHKTVHHIYTTGPPATAHFNCHDTAKLAAAKAEFWKLEKEGVIWRSASNWTGPLHMVMKPDGTWRPCGLIIAASAWLQHQTYIRCQTFRTYLRDWVAAPSSVNWIYGRVTTKYPSRKGTSTRRWCSLLLGCGNSFACLLGWGTPASPSRDSWTRCWANWISPSATWTAFW